MPVKINDIIQFGGKTGFFFRNLTNGGTVTHNADIPIEAASLIKLFVMAEFFRQSEKGITDPYGTHTVLDSEKLPSCGALTYLSEDTELTWLDLCTLMIILSDNTAANILIRHLGMENINETIQGCGFTGTFLNRLLFDGNAAARGLRNYTTAADCGRFLKMIYEGELVSERASGKMLGMLKNQRLNGKMPFFLHSRTTAAVAHKTGEDSGITHDVGIVLAEHPFIVCFLSESVDVPVFERFIQDKTYEIYKELNR